MGITAKQIRSKLIEQYGGGIPFAVNFDNLPKDFEYDEKNSFLDVKCNQCQQIQSLTPDEIFSLKGKYGLDNQPCPVCTPDKGKKRPKKNKEEEDEKSVPDTEPVEVREEHEEIEPKTRETDMEEEKHGEQDSSVSESGDNKQPPEEEKNGGDNPTDTSESEGDSQDDDEDSVDFDEEDEHEENESEEDELDFEKSNEALWGFEKEILDVVENLDTELGYSTYDTSSIKISQNDDGKIESFSIECACCGERSEYKSVDEINKMVELEDKEKHHHVCKKCLESMYKSMNKFGVIRNIAMLKRVQKHLDRISDERCFVEISKKDSSVRNYNSEVTLNLVNNGMTFKKRFVIADIMEIESYDELLDMFVTKKPEEALKDKQEEKQPEKEQENKTNEDKKSEESTEDSVEIDLGDDEVTDQASEEPKQEEISTESEVVSKEKPSKSDTKEEKVQKDEDDFVIDIFIGDEEKVEETTKEVEKEEKKEEVTPKKETVKPEKKKEEVKEKKEEKTDEEDDDEVIDICLGESSPDNIGGTSKRDKKSSKESDPFDKANCQDSLESLKKEKKERESKWYSQRVFLSDEEMYEFNPLEDDETLLEKFMKTNSGKLITSVEERAGIPVKIRCDSDTWDVPICDFSTGVRVVCINVEDEGQMKLPPEFERNIPFQFGKVKYKRLYLYSDSVCNAEKMIATRLALLKIVNLQGYDERRVINIGGRYTLFYTKDLDTVRDFEDQNSPSANRKPSNGQLAVIALRDKKNLTSKDLMKMLNTQTFDLKSQSMYIVASIRYIEMPKDATNTIEYLITDYTELACSIVKDGLAHAIGALLKIHDEKYPLLDCKIQVEFDRSIFPSPSLEIYYDTDQFLFKTTDEESKICYMRQKHARVKPEDSYRQDYRLMTAISLLKRFPQEIAASGYDIRNKKLRNAILEHLGFYKCYQPAIETYMISPLYLLELRMTSSVMFMEEIDLSSFFKGRGVYDGNGYDALLMQRMLTSKDNETSSDDIMDDIMNAFLMERILM